MSRTITIVTPENVPVTYQLAGVASRFMATVVDLLLQVVSMALVVMLINRFHSGGIALGSFVSAVGIVVAFLLIPFGYAILFEMLWGGRTPGKRLFGLRVIRDGGYPINLVSSALRNLLRFIDFGIAPPIVLCGLPGLLCIFCSPTYKRIGDYAAGTLVVVEGGLSPLDTGGTTQALSPGAAPFLTAVRNVDRLTPAQYRVLRRFTSRRQTMELVVQAALGEKLARPLMQQLQIDVPIYYQVQYADLLEAIERCYAEEHGIL